MKNNYALQHNHITADEIKFILAIDMDTAGNDALYKAVDIWEKIDNCSVCGARLRFGIDAQVLLDTLIPESTTVLSPELLRVSLAERAAAILQEKFGELETGLSEAVSRWLSGTMDLLGSLEPISFRPAFAGATRGLHADEIEIDLTQNENDAQFDFELVEKTSVVFRVSEKTTEGTPLFIIIVGRDETSFSEVYPLNNPLAAINRPGKVAKLSSPTINLEPGKYSIIVPAI